MSNPLISVVIPVYNAEKYLDECIQSVVNQTYKKLEIILVNDGSTDRSAQMCDEWACKDNRIKVVHKKNGGASTARNAGLKTVTGDYVGFVDSDDFIAEHMYETLLRGIQNNEERIATCYTVRTSGKEEVCQLKKTTPARYGEQEALSAFFSTQEITSSVCDKLFDSKLFREIRFPEGETNEEYPILIPLFMSSHGVYHTGETMYYYRKTEGSITDSTWKTDASIVLEHLREMEEQIKKYGLKMVIPSFRLFCANSAYAIALQLDKNYPRINDAAKRNFKEYIRIMRKYAMKITMSKTVNIKDKILYGMVATRTLRPIYKLLGRL